MKKIITSILALAMIFAALTTLLTACSSKYDVYVIEMDIKAEDKDFGTIRVKLDRTSAPATVDNFISLIESGYYVGKTLHRAQQGFVIQGGSANGDGISDGSAATIPGEFSANGFEGNNISHREGVISMARTEDPNSASAQFFITLGDARASLDGEYAGFGFVDKESMKIVHEVAEYMYPYTSGSKGMIPLSSKDKMPIISGARVVDQYNID